MKSQIKSNYAITPFTYKDIEQCGNSYSINLMCTAMQFNYNSTTLAIGFEKGLIQLYNFKNGQIKQIVQNNRRQSPSWFSFLSKSQQYFTCNWKHVMLLWSQNCVSNHKFIEKTKEQNLLMILFNQQEDLMIIGYSKGIISFKKKQTHTWSNVNKIQISQALFNLALNQSETILAAKIENTNILIIQKMMNNDNQNWIVKQQIDCNEIINHMIFINNSLIAIQTLSSRLWKLYKQGKNQNEFNFKRRIQIPGMDEDMQYILSRLPSSDLNHQNLNNNFLNLRFGIGKQYLSFEYNDEFNLTYKGGWLAASDIKGEYISYIDSYSKQIVIAQFTQLQWEYKLVKSQSTKIDEFCQAIAINSFSTILLIGVNKSIKIYSIDNLNIQQLQQLDAHLGLVNCLQFMNKNNSFVSGSQDKTLRIWQWDENSKNYQCLQILNEFVECRFVTTNIQEDSIILGGENQITFWKNLNQKWIDQQKLQFDDQEICGLSLSPSQQRLITCLENKKILVFQQIMKSNQTYWEIQTEINVIQAGYSLFLQNDDLIALQLVDKTQIAIYQFDKNKQQFQQISQILFTDHDLFGQIKFPFLYNKMKNLFIVKARCNFYFVTISDNQQLSKYQKISFGNDNILGVLSEDGKQFISWDYGEKSIQIRQFKSYYNQSLKF